MLNDICLEATQLDEPYVRDIQLDNSRDDFNDEYLNGNYLFPEGFFDGSRIDEKYFGIGIPMECR